MGRLEQHCAAHMVISAPDATGLEFDCMIFERLFLYCCAAPLSRNDYIFCLDLKIRVYANGLDCLQCIHLRHDSEVAIRHGDALRGEVSHRQISMGTGCAVGVAVASANPTNIVGPGETGTRKQSLWDYLSIEIART